LSASEDKTFNVNIDRRPTIVPDFKSFSSSLLGLPVSLVWRGYGSALFLEFGSLQPEIRPDGSSGNPRGEWTLMIEWSWRIEGKRKILCGSWSNEARWPRVFSRLQGTTVESASLFGHLPEIAIKLANGLSVVSIMTAEGDPAWALLNRRKTTEASLSVRSGRLHLVPFDVG
jgi:hypothetical protein